MGTKEKSPRFLSPKDISHEYRIHPSTARTWIDAFGASGGQVFQRGRIIRVITK